MLHLCRECEITQQATEKTHVTAHSCFKSVISVGLKFGKSLGGRSFIKPFAADLCCSLSGGGREP